MSRTPDWADDESRRLLDFARGSRLPDGGFGWLDATGRPEVGRAQELWITCRMTYVFALAHLRGEPDAAAYVDHGLAALAGPFRDARHGGWWSRVGGPAPLDPVPGSKAAYDHAFVLLAGAAATVAGRPGGRDLLDQAIEVVDEHFWDDTSGTVLETWSADWSTSEAYRGANANMHAVEAFLAVADATGDGRWRERALRIQRRLVGHAREHGGRMPEHYDAHWRPLLDFNRAQPAHPFRPYGATVGHGFEWTRLTAQLAAATDEDLGDDARFLFDAAVRDGWAVDGEPGFVYTVDWDGTPVVRERMHWVAAEAVLAAHALGEPAEEWWAFIREHHVDEAGGSWWHELDAHNRRSATVWAGKPDVYHAYQACVLPSLPLHPSAAVALAARG